MSQTLLLLPGDGIGPEVTEQARRVAEVLVPDLQFTEDLVGGASIDAHGEPLTVDALVKAKSSDAVLLGAVGGPKWVGVDRHLRPEMGLLQLRKGMDTFANLRPAFCFPALVDASSLKREIVDGLDIMIVRELTSGVYFGEPRGFERGIGDKSFGYETSRYTKGEIDRVARVAFEIARGRRGEVASTEKSNVMESGQFWRETVIELHESEGKGVALRHVLADACAMNWSAPRSSLMSSSPATCSAISFRMQRRCAPDRLACCQVRLSAMTESQACTNQSMGQRQILPGKVKPILALRSCRLKWRCAGHWAAQTLRTNCLPQSARRSMRARAQATLAALCRPLKWAMR